VRPSAEKVEGQRLLADMRAALARHAFVSDHDAIKTLLWVIHGYRRDVGEIAVLPRLVVTAGKEDSGKTACLSTLMHMCERPEHMVSPRSTTLYRLIEQERPVLGLDEADVWYPRDPDVREIVNSGFNAEGAHVTRCVDTDGRGNYEVRRYSTFTPIAIVGNNLEKVLDRTVLSRAIIVRMRPARCRRTSSATRRPTLG
jgi:hypothetical protein